MKLKYKSNNLHYNSSRREELFQFIILQISLTFNAPTSSSRNIQCWGLGLNKTEWNSLKEFRNIFLSLRRKVTSEYSDKYQSEGPEYVEWIPSVEVWNIWDSWPQPGHSWRIITAGSVGWWCWYCTVSLQMVKVIHYPLLPPHPAPGFILSLLPSQWPGWPQRREVRRVCGSPLQSGG